MFHMLTCFNLKNGVDIGEFRVAFDALNEQLQSTLMIHSVSAIGQRQRHPIMDTDNERDHEYFFTMTFENRAQCDRAVETMSQKVAPVDALHREAYSKIADPVFICWMDLDS